TTLPTISQLVLFLLLVGVTISASSYGVGNNNPLLQNRVTLFLGAISLPVYLSQNVVRAVVRTMNLPIRGSSHFVLVVVLTYAVSVIAVLLNHRSTRPHHG
ncbi:MAG: hypothetical protein J6S63_11765, partial [Atopobiaceae bacterium]|nr:hypothetical protein [Atopobiaceae bacterium]